MRVLLLTTAHNSLSQRAEIELRERGHEVSVELALSDDVMLEAVALFRPQLIVAPFLKRAIPEAIWRRHLCIIVHPGIEGDRGPSSLDWAILEARPVWGVTLLQAIADLDAGAVWATHTFEAPLRALSKSSLYRGPVTETAMRCLLEVVERAARLGPLPLARAESTTHGVFRPLMKQSDRTIDWQTDPTACIARKIRAADSQPGVVDVMFDTEYCLFGAHEEDQLRGEPGRILAVRHGAICRGTVDGAIWITHLKQRGRSIKLPATAVLGERVADVPVSELPVDASVERRSFREIQYVEDGAIGYLHFDFYNGAMSADQCHRLRHAFVQARARPTRVIVLMGGVDFFSNGIHLNVIEAASDPGEESWRNIQAIDDFVLEVLTTMSHRVVAVLRGNAGAGGAMLALAADEVWARAGVVLNPHYRSMGGLYGSEYWTYTLPRRVGEQQAHELTRACLPIGTTRALKLGLLDAVLPDPRHDFALAVRTRACQLAEDPAWTQRLADKQQKRARDEAMQPLASYRRRELTRMYGSFFAPDSEYHEARRRFVYKLPPPCTPLHFARHRRVPVSNGLGAASVLDA